LPPSALALRTAVTTGAPKVSMKLDTEPRNDRMYGGRRGSLALPIAFQGVAEGDQVLTEAVESEIVTASGQRFRELPRRRAYNHPTLCPPTPSSSPASAMKKV